MLQDKLPTLCGYLRKIHTRSLDKLIQYQSIEADLSPEKVTIIYTLISEELKGVFKEPEPVDHYEKKQQKIHIKAAGQYKNSNWSIFSKVPCVGKTLDKDLEENKQSANEASIIKLKKCTL